MALEGVELLYLIRHAETPWNRRGLYQGRVDVPLSRRGRLQARQLARALARSGIGAVVTSDLRRAQATARPLARRLGARLLVEPGLREMDFGRWEGLTAAEVRRRFAAEWAAYRADPVRVPAGGGESFLQLAERVSEAWQRAARQAGVPKVALVAHGASLRAIVCDLLGLPYGERRRLTVDNASITLFRLGEYPRLVCLNVTSHLRTLRGDGRWRPRLRRTAPRLRPAAPRLG